MRWLYIALHIFTLLACTTHKEKSSPSERTAQIDTQIFETASTLDAITGDSGWPSVTDCDGTLWAGIACAGGHLVKIDLAEYEPGQIHRRPAPSCWNAQDGDVGAKATTSPDMLEGYMLCRWEQGDLAAFQRLADYGESHDWVMGAPITDLRVIMRPNLMGILGRIIFKLSGGADNRIYRHVAASYPPVAEDSEKHLQALGIVFQGEVSEGAGESLLDIDGKMLERLKQLAADEPLNPGYQTALGIYTGDMDPAVDLFLDPTTPRPSYIRGDSPDAFALAERLYWLKKARARMRD